MGHQAIAVKEKHKSPQYNEPSEILKEIRPIVELCVDLLAEVSNSSSNRANLEAEFDNAKKTSDEFWRYAAQLNHKLIGSDDWDQLDS